ncbi:Dienelactone hydrolase endo--beta-d-glucanase [Mycena venus]|uniref:Dienelactone hydrolase endo--beta-d-glucanase n=1 Tax=Mycena venus TaxID=2733690 RepID=A0A8H6XY75_9AGAR|nr:Dienelactone hydrolase endo--beta-d-glucanase [Mycena venus]
MELLEVSGPLLVVLETHTGTGKIEFVAGVQCYIATPSCDYIKEKVLLYLTDVFGIPLVNKLLADAFARKGFKTVIMDYHNNDSIPVGTMHRPSAMTSLGGSPSTLLSSAARRSHSSCPQGRWGNQFALDGVIAAASVHHLSFLDVPGDLEKYAATVTAPLLINSCEMDWQFGPDAQAQADVIFANFEPGYKREYFEGCDHGFAVRGDVKVPKIKAGKEEAFEATVEWMKKYL